MSKRCNWMCISSGYLQGQAEGLTSNQSYYKAIPLSISVWYYHHLWNMSVADFLHCNTIGRADEVDKAQVISKNQCTTAVTWARAGACSKRSSWLTFSQKQNVWNGWIWCLPHVFNGWAKGSNLWRGGIAKWYVFKTSYFYYNPWPSFSFDDSGQNQQ